MLKEATKHILTDKNRWIDIEPGDFVKVRLCKSEGCESEFNLNNVNCKLT